jgi:eukaryotic-like serine/threonine-protein kinase
MTPERWDRIDELFDASLKLAPAEREAWLRGACGDDESLRADVARLLELDEQAARDRFLTGPTGPASTGTWPSQDTRRRPREPEPSDHDGAMAREATLFAPRAAIADGSRPQPIAAAETVVRARLRELPMIYILIVAMATFFRCVVLGDADLVLYYLDVTVVACLGGVIALLSSRRPVPLARLRVLELGMIAMLAGRVATVEYRLILEGSVRGDPLLAQLTTKNIVLLTSILMLTYALYVPKSWRRAAMVVGPLALLPFATLFTLYLRHPEAMGWLGLVSSHCETPRFWLFSFDLMTLVIVAVGCSLGAHMISGLRRQVAEARQLGQYRLRRRIGGGGMGEVYLAEHQLLKRPCAVKLIRPDGATEPRALERFEREVRLTATLSHPNTVDVYDYGRAEDGTYYYVMEYLEGPSLAELVERHGPLSPGRAVYLLRQVCQALREAHAAGLIHRDIKPSNILAARSGGMDDVAKLLDFGLVLPAASSSTPDLSTEGQILGTPLFMSPEQAMGGHRLDERSDIYSLGAVAYYLLTGRPPFDMDSGLGAMIAHIHDPVVPPSLIHDGIPEDLEGVVLRCLAKDATDRFPDAASLEGARAECACAADWDQEHAARWSAEGHRAACVQVPAGDSSASPPRVAASR